MTSEEKDLYGKKLPTGDEIVEELKKQQKDNEFRYAYMVGALTAHYNNLLMQIEVMQMKSKKSKN